MPIQGMEQFIGNLQKLANIAAGEGSVAAVRKGSETILKRATDLVPVDTGNLRDSGFVIDPVVGGGQVTGGVGYTAEYALYVHEGHRIVAWGHDTGKEQPADKWLERAVLDVLDEVRTDMAEAFFDAEAEAIG